MRTDDALRGPRRAWTTFIVALAGVLAVGLVVDTSPSELPAALPVALTVVTGLGALAAIVAIQRGLASAAPADDGEARGELAWRSALSLAIALAPVLLGVALAAVFGHRASIIAATALGIAAGAVGFPRVSRLEQIERSWRDRGIDASIFGSDGAE